MRSRNRQWQWASGAAGLLIAAALEWGCAPMTVHSYTERGADLRQYHTYSWGAADTWSTGDPRLDNNRFFDERVRSRVELALEERGFEKTASSQPDLQLHYHINVTQDIERPGFDQQYTCTGHDCMPQIFEKGTLVIDLIDARTNKVVWRGWAESNIDGVVDSQSWMEARIDDVVARIFQGFHRAS